MSNKNTWNFVSVDQAGLPKNAQDRTAIRKAAMRTFRQHQRIERVKAYRAECAAKAIAQASPAASSSPACDPPCVSGNLRRESPPPVISTLARRISTTPVESLYGDVARADSKTPLSCADEESSVQTLIQLDIPKDLGYPLKFSDAAPPNPSYLFDYFVSVIIPIMLPIDGDVGQKAVRGFWGGSLLRNPLALNAAISHAAIHMDVSDQRPLSPSTASQLSHTLRLINERLESQSQFVCNEVIEAVALVATNSNITGDMIECKIHMDGLKEMVRLRGGRENLGPDGIIQPVLFWSDTTAARITRSRPRFAPANPKTPVAEKLPISITASTPFKEDIFSLIEELRQLTALKAAIEANASVTIDDIMAFDKRRNMLEERILCLQHILLTTTRIDFNSQLLEICCLAASIYIILAFRNFRSEFSILRTLKEDLMTSVLKIEAVFVTLQGMPDEELPCAELLVWALFIGGSLALDTAEKTWFADRISLVIPWAQVASWEEAEACLGRLLWIDKLNNAACRLLWDEVEGILTLNLGKVSVADVLLPMV